MTTKIILASSLIQLWRPSSLHSYLLAWIQVSPTEAVAHNWGEVHSSRIMVYQTLINKNLGIDLINQFHLINWSQKSLHTQFE